ncbi:unnamed protein product [Nezara viridula]|uniref:Armadillo repeat-containing protein 1 n=1 Tax=Nezara viridula TaxID=85310 RepID=A0A9P0E3W8_NEZVI|nr:unnamed protein product [Nezara viridula]
MSEKEIILSYKEMASDVGNHLQMIKDKTAIQFLAYSLDHKDPEVVKESLKAIECLVKNTQTHSALRTTFGVLEALKATKDRNDLDNSLLNLAKDIHSKLEHPSYVKQTVNKFEGQIKKKSSKVYSFHVFGLNKDTRTDLECALVRIRGVISVLLDVEHQRCTVRAVEKVTPEIIVNYISEKTKLQARLVVKNRLNQEMLVAVSDDIKATVDEVDLLPAYLPEEEPPVKEKAISIFGFERIKASAAGIINTATALFQNSFYW